MAMSVVYIQSVAALGLTVTVLGLGASLVYLSAGQYLLKRTEETSFVRVLFLGIIFPSGLILANTRATWEAFSNAGMVFVRTPKAGAASAGGWKGRPELAVGVLLPVFAITEQAWSAPFFAFAATGLLSIGFMGWTGATQLPARRDAAIATNKQS